MQDDYGTEIIAIEEPPNNGQISISSSLNQLGKPFLLDRKIYFLPKFTKTGRPHP